MSGHFCLVLQQVQKCAGSNYLGWPKLIQKLNLLSFFGLQQKNLGLAQYVNQFLVKNKTYGSAQNILGYVEGQDIHLLKVA